MHHPAKKTVRQPASLPPKGEPPPQIAIQLVEDQPKRAEQIWKQWLERNAKGSKLDDIEARARAATAGWHPQKPMSRETTIFMLRARDDVLSLCAGLREALEHAGPVGVEAPE